MEVIAASTEDIHAVTAIGERPTISIHVYGADIERLGTSIYRRFDDWPIRGGALSAAAPDSGGVRSRCDWNRGDCGL